MIKKTQTIHPKLLLSVVPAMRQQLLHFPVLHASWDWRENNHRQNQAEFALRPAKKKKTLTISQLSSLAIYCASTNQIMIYLHPQSTLLEKRVLCLTLNHTPSETARQSVTHVAKHKECILAASLPRHVYCSMKSLGIKVEKLPWLTQFQCFLPP